MVRNSGLPKHITVYTSDPVHLETHTRTPPRPERRRRAAQECGGNLTLGYEIGPRTRPCSEPRRIYRELFIRAHRRAFSVNESDPFLPPRPPFQYLSIKNTARKLWFSFCPKLLDLRWMRFSSSHNESRMNKRTHFFFFLRVYLRATFSHRQWPLWSSTIVII